MMPTSNEDAEKTPITVVTGFLGVSACQSMLLLLDAIVALIRVLSMRAEYRSDT